MSRTGPHRRVSSAVSYVVVRGSRGLGGGRDGGDETAGRAVTEGVVEERRVDTRCRSRHTRSRRKTPCRANSTVVKVARAVVSDDASGCCAVGPLCNVPEDAHADTVNAVGAANDKPRMTVSSPSPPAPATRRHDSKLLATARDAEKSPHRGDLVGGGNGRDRGLLSCC